MNVGLKKCHISYLRMWQLLELYLLPWVVVFSSKASICCTLSFDLIRSSAISRPSEAFLCSTANWSKVLALPIAFCCWWMESVCVETSTSEKKRHYTSSQTSDQNLSCFSIKQTQDTGSTEFTLHIRSRVHSFFLSGSTTRHCLFRLHSFSMGKKANTGVSEQQQDTANMIQRLQNSALI